MTRKNKFCRTDEKMTEKCYPIICRECGTLFMISRTRLKRELEKIKDLTKDHKTTHLTGYIDGGMGISDYDFSDTDNMRVHVWCSNCVDMRPKEKVNKK